MAYLSLVPETLDNKRRFLPTGILDWTSDVCLSGREIYAGGEFRLMPFIVGQVDERGLPRGERIPGTNPSRSRVNCLMVVSSCARGRLRAGAQLLGRPRHDPIESAGRGYGRVTPWLRVSSCARGRRLGQRFRSGGAGPELWGLFGASRSKPLAEGLVSRVNLLDLGLARARR